jgi:hypothetical protein
MFDLIHHRIAQNVAKALPIWRQPVSNSETTARRLSLCRPMR